MMDSWSPSRCSSGPVRDEDEPTAVEDVEPESVRLSAARAGWTVAGMTVLFWGFQLFGYVDIYPFLSVAVVVLGLWGLGTIVAVWHPRPVPPTTARVLAIATLGLTIGAFLLWSFLQIHASPAYGTDEIAFDQYAAQLLQHGLNPYTHSMANAFSLFHVSPDGYTFLLNGQPVTSLSYPALSFLLYMPFLLAGWSSQLAVAINVLAWAIGIVLTFALLPRSLRPLAIVIGSFSVYISYAVGGVTDALFVPLLIGAVYKWDQFPRLRGCRRLPRPGTARSGHGGEADPLAGASISGCRGRARSGPTGRAFRGTADCVPIPGDRVRRLLGSQPALHRHGPAPMAVGRAHPHREP